MRKKIYINVILTALMTIFFSVSAGAQATKVKGRVTDSESGEGIPFAAVYFYGTTIGVSTDMEGYYSMETRDSTANTLCAALLGYERAAGHSARWISGSTLSLLRLMRQW